MGDLGRPEEKWQPTGWGAVAQAGPGQGFFIFSIFFFFYKKIFYFFYKKNILIFFTEVAPWLPGRGARGPGALVYGARVPGTPT